MRSAWRLSGSLNRESGTARDAHQHCCLNLVRMDPPAPNNKRSFSKLLSKEWNKSFRQPPTPSASQSPSSMSVSPSPLPGDQTRPAGSSLGNEGQAIARTSIQTPPPLPASGLNYPAPRDSGDRPPTIVVSSAATDSSNVNEILSHSVTPTAGPTHPTDDRAISKVWAGLVTGLQALSINRRLPSPLQSAIGSFIPCLDVLEVRVLLGCGGLIGIDQVVVLLGYRQASSRVRRTGVRAPMCS